MSASRTAEWLRCQLDYQASEVPLFEQALRHRSAAGANNERLEFLGDAVLNLIVAEYLYRHYPAADEGALSRLRAAVVSGASLARVAAALDLGSMLALGAGELKTGGFRRESILADALEAVCGALYLEAGFASARSAFLRVLDPTLAPLAASAAGAVDEQKDAKTRLQEWLQARALGLPHYEVTAVHGEAHEQEFHVACSVEGLAQQAAGSGSSRRRAEQEAAARLLALLDP